MNTHSVYRFQKYGTLSFSYYQLPTFNLFLCNFSQWLRISSDFNIFLRTVQGRTYLNVDRFSKILQPILGQTKHQILHGNICLQLIYLQYICEISISQTENHTLKIKSCNFRYRSLKHYHILSQQQTTSC